METTYVTGHRNPDTDSIVAAMAYAALRAALGDRSFAAARLGPVSDETQMVLDRFGFEPPALLYSLRTQVRDLDFDTPPVLSSAVPISRAWNVLQSDGSVPAVPVVDAQGRLTGMLTAGDIAAYDIRSIENPVLENVPLFNLLSVLEGHELNDAMQLGDDISGEVLIAMPKAHDAPIFTDPNCVLLCGQQPEIIRAAVDAGVRTLILCQAELEPEAHAAATRTRIITTPLDVNRASRLVYHALPIDRICSKGELHCFRLDDYIDDVRERVLQNRYRCYPILDENGKVAGTLSRYHLLRPRRKRVVLVDHNEAAQSVPGLEQAEVVEIIDHHRLADIQTANPIYFRNEPVGSTATIIAGMYQEKGIVPTDRMAGLLASAIVSDTVMFKSPTCTDRDRRMAECMARIAGVSLEELGYDIFAASSSDNKSAEELLFADFKEFHIAGHMLGIGQVTCIDSAHILERSAELLDVMRKTMKEKRYDTILLMLTDVLREGTQLLFIGEEETIQQAFNVEAKDNACFLPKILSRKKQVVPMLSLLWG